MKIWGSWRGWQMTSLWEPAWWEPGHMVFDSHWAEGTQRLRPAWPVSAPCLPNPDLCFLPRCGVDRVVRTWPSALHKRWRENFRPWGHSTRKNLQSPHWYTGNQEVIKALSWKRCCRSQTLLLSEWCESHGPPVMSVMPENSILVLKTDLETDCMLQASPDTAPPPLWFSKPGFRFSSGSCLRVPFLSPQPDLQPWVRVPSAGSIWSSRLHTLIHFFGGFKFTGCSWNSGAVWDQPRWRTPTALFST